MKIYTDDNFLKSDNANISYGFFTRIGGVSDGVYKGLNCGIGSEDETDNVANNRAMVAQHFDCQPDHLLSLYQVHGDAVHDVSKPWQGERPHGDGFVTDQPGLALGILTADCAPVLFYGSKSSGHPIIGAAHAGWGGALKGVLEATASAMEEGGAVKSTIRACVGPCIGKASYEVSESFIEPFLKEDDEAERFFFGAAKQGHLMFDLSGYCAWRLFRAQVKAVTLIDKDTYKNADEFYSYRRSTHEKQSDYGRQISVIAIRK